MTKERNKTEIYYALDLENVTDEQLLCMMALMPEDRRQRTMKYRRRENRVESVCAWILLRYAYYKKTGRVLPPVVRDANGKPRFEQTAGFTPAFFNLSHTDGAVCCAVSDAETGADIQIMEKADRKIAEHFMSARELETLESLMAADGVPSVDDPSAADAFFTKIWALKESRFKLDGSGICGNMKEFECPDSILCNSSAYAEEGFTVFCDRVNCAESGLQYYLAAWASGMPEICVRRVNIADCVDLP